MAIEEDITKINETVLREKKIVKEINSLNNSIKNSEAQEKKLINSQITHLTDSLRDMNNELFNSLDRLRVQRPLSKQIKIENPEKIPEKKTKPTKSSERMSELEKEVIKRLKKKKEKKSEKKEKNPSKYTQYANNLFAVYVKTWFKQNWLSSLEKDLIKSNILFTPVGYLSVLMLTTIIAAAASLFIFIFLLFFNIGIELPIITLATGNFWLRFIELVWIIFLIPAGTFTFMFFYPSLEKKSVERKINQELPFATIHMASIAGSLIEPTRVFKIISSTGEYPHLTREFNKLLNEINIYGYDLVTALKDSAVNSPSQKLAELFNGLATTITSGGDLFEFFDKRSQSLLFEYRLDKEKRTKSAETFMDIYISVVIAAPMILMLLLMMMKISGLGISLSTSALTFLVVGGVSLINVFFLIFLQLKQPEAI